jgi:hypothetical protein
MTGAIAEKQSMARAFPQAVRNKNVAIPKAALRSRTLKVLNFIFVSPFYMVIVDYFSVVDCTPIVLIGPSDPILCSGMTLEETVTWVGAFVCEEDGLNRAPSMEGKRSFALALQELA